MTKLTPTAPNWLHDRLVEYGARCVVTPRSLIPQEAGARVKTDRLDSRRLARLLSKGNAQAGLGAFAAGAGAPAGHPPEKAVDPGSRRDRVRTQNRVKSELRIYGIEPPKPEGPWTKTYVENLRRARFPSRRTQESFSRLLEQYEFLSEQLGRQTRLLRELAQTEICHERVRILCSVPGVGLISVMKQIYEWIKLRSGASER